MKGYSIIEMSEKSARSIRKNCNISLKDAVNIAHNIKGMDLAKAEDLLEAVMKKERPIKYFRYLDSVSHRKGYGPGRYPVRAVKQFQSLIGNVKANAEFKGLDTDSLKIVMVTADKGPMLKRFTPKAYGRAGANNRDMVHLSIVVEEVEK
ncbi:MAG: 50S ribosomal protein L22 [Cuniculiplasma sp.]